MRQASDENEYRVLDATQLAVKILLNSFYGYSGYARARLYSLTLANAVTSFGRSNILEYSGKLSIILSAKWFSGMEQLYSLTKPENFSSFGQGSRDIGSLRRY